MPKLYVRLGRMLHRERSVRLVSLVLLVGWLAKSWSRSLASRKLAMMAISRYLMSNLTVMTLRAVRMTRYYWLRFRKRDLNRNFSFFAGGVSSFRAHISRWVINQRYHFVCASQPSPQYYVDIRITQKIQGGAPNLLFQWTHMHSLKVDRESVNKQGTLDGNVAAAAPNSTVYKWGSARLYCRVGGLRNEVCLLYFDIISSNPDKVTTSWQACSANPTQVQPGSDGDILSLSRRCSRNLVAHIEKTWRSICTSELNIHFYRFWSFPQRNTHFVKLGPVTDGWIPWHRSTGI